MNRVPLYQIDAFTSVPFHGNPAAVCLLPFAIGDKLMQAIAAEMALSETAFLLRTNHRRWASGETFSLRWFTPTTEVALCGHATLASAAALFGPIGVKAPILTFQTMSGDLFAHNTPEGVALDFPTDPPKLCDAPGDVLEALNLEPIEVEQAAFGPVTQKLLLHLTEASRVRALTPDFGGLVRAESMAAYKGLIVTAEDEPPYDFVSRYFGPWVGIDEDPVTGSAHTVLAPYWGGRLGKTRMQAYQASARGGELGVGILGDGRVEIVGQAALVLEGYLSLPHG